MGKEYTTHCARTKFLFDHKVIGNDTSAGERAVWKLNHFAAVCAGVLMPHFGFGNFVDGEAHDALKF
jgi:hypothetical protein